MKATPMVIQALSALYADENLQLQGLKMIQTISKTAEGWRQISETRGDWQSITQGAVLGNALVHALNVSWTPSGLRDYMGISMQNTYFDLLPTLDLLSKPGEEREQWFIRIKFYETKFNVLLDDMVKTMLDLKRKEIQKSKVPIAVNAEDAAKEIYVLGQLVTTKMLSETDLNLQEIMTGKA